VRERGPANLPVMRAEGYRSYVIRIRRRLAVASAGEVAGGAAIHDAIGEALAGATVPAPAGASGGSSLRLEVEDLLEGGRAQVTGPTAERLAEALEALFAGGRAGAETPWLAVEERR
jgi:hypothetical protein